MIYRGRVLEIEKNYAIVITDSFEYIRIVYKRNLEIGKEIIFLKEDIYKEKKFDAKKLAISAAVLLIMILSISLFGQLSIFNNISNAAAAIISIDINPSIEFEINEEYEVIRIVPVNNEGKNLVDKKMIGMDVREVLLKVVDNAFQKKYITDNKNTILISTLIINDNLEFQSEKLEQEIDSIITQKINNEKINIAFISGKKENFKKARKENISIGKYEVYKESKIKNNETTIEQIKNMKVSKIIDEGMNGIRIRKQNMNQNKNQNNVEIMNANIENEKTIQNKFRNSNKKNKENNKMNANGKNQRNGLKNSDMKKSVQTDNNFIEEINEIIDEETIVEEIIENINNENNDNLDNDLEDCDESEKRKRKRGNEGSKEKKESKGS